MLAALNSIRRKARRRLRRASSARRIMRGGKACRPLIARDGLEPCADRAGARLSRHAQRAGALRRAAARARRSRRAGSRRSISATRPWRSTLGDRVILAVPPMVAASLVPDLTTPTTSRAIVNAHFRLDAAGRSSADDRHAQLDHRMAVRVIRAGSRPRPAAPTGCSTSRARNSPRRSGARSRKSPALPADLPPWQIVRERRATFAATPEENAPAPRRSNGIRQSLPCGRLDRHGLARDHRRCHSVRQPGSRSGAART